MIFCFVNFSRELASLKRIRFFFFSPQQQQLIDQLKQVFGNRPNLLIKIDNIKPLSETKCQATIYIEEKSATSNETKRILATEVASYLNQPTPKSQIGSLGVEQVIALVLPDEDQLKEYLDSAPKGIDPRLWKQAIQDNPDPTKLIPVPIVGFNEVGFLTFCAVTLSKSIFKSPLRQ